MTLGETQLRLRGEWDCLVAEAGGCGDGAAETYRFEHGRAEKRPLGGSGECVEVSGRGGAQGVSDCGL